ncbi:MAG: oligosaccharide flippase family protein [Phycisphaerae bacterium]
MKLAGRSATIIFTEFFRSITTLAMGIVLSRLLSKAQYGTFSQAFMVYTLFSTILSLSLPQSLYFFIPKSKDKDQPLVMSQTLILTLTLAAAAGCFMYFSAPLLSRWMNNSELTNVLKVMSFYPLADMISQLVSPALISVGKVGYSAVFGFIFAIVRIFSIVWPVAAKYPLPDVIKVMVIAAFATAGVGLVMIVLILRIHKVWFSKTLLWEQLEYSIPLAGALAVGLLGRQLDKWIISIFFSPEQYAIFSNGAAELPLVGVLTGGLAAAILPEMVKSASANKLMDAVSLWQRSSRVCALAMFPTFVLALLLAPQLIVLMFSFRYSQSTYPFIVYLFVLPLRVVIFASLLRALSYTSPIMIGAILSLTINAVLGIGLVKLAGKGMAGFLSPAAASVISQYLSAWYLLYAIKKVSGVSISKILPWGHLARLLLLSAVAGIPVLPILWTNLPDTTKILTATVIYLAGYVSMVFGTRWLTEEEKNLLARFFRLKQA